MNWSIFLVRIFVMSIHLFHIVNAIDTPRAPSRSRKSHVQPIIDQAKVKPNKELDNVPSISYIDVSTPPWLDPALKPIVQRYKAPIITEIEILTWKLKH